MQKSAAGRPYADLWVSEVAAADAGLAGSELTVAWRVVNQGAVAAGDAWTDTVLLRRAGIADIVLASVRQSPTAHREAETAKAHRG